MLNSVPTDWRSLVCAAAKLPMISSFFGRRGSSQLAPYPHPGLQTGSLLLGTTEAPTGQPEGGGRHYWHSAVMLVIEHEPWGFAKALVLNHSLKEKPVTKQSHLRTLCETHPASAAPRHGGPEGDFEIFCLHCRKRVGAREVIPGVFVGGSQAAIAAAIADSSSSDDDDDDGDGEVTAEDEVDEVQSRHCVVLRGAAVWGRGQLEAELKRRSWDVIPPALLQGEVGAGLIFGGDASSCWRRARALLPHVERSGDHGELHPG